VALINFMNSERVEKERNSVHNEVRSTYTSFTNKAGEKFFQIDTYGSSNRQIQGKISQSIQFDREAATEIINLLKNEFKI
jgi:thymidylate kinase